MLRRDVCALGMGQRSNFAVSMDAKTVLKMEDCARGMEHRSNDAAMRDAPIMWT